MEVDCSYSSKGVQTGGISAENRLIKIIRSNTNFAESLRTLEEVSQFPRITRLLINVRTRLPEKNKSGPQYEAKASETHAREHDQSTIQYWESSQMDSLTSDSEAAYHEKGTKSQNCMKLHCLEAGAA